MGVQKKVNDFDRTNTLLNALMHIYIHIYKRYCCQNHLLLYAKT
jgi:hypothetical protein